MKTWDYYGKRDPYYGVLSADEFRSGRMDAGARQRFFDSGEEQVKQFVAIAEESFGALKHGTALDYGCGVGRLTRALAGRFERVIAVDISSDMLAEAQRNLADRQNVHYEQAGAMGADAADFLMSKIVFQHVKPALGLSILGTLAQRLSERGVGVIDVPVAYAGGLLRRSLRALRPAWRFGEPVIPMSVYELDQLEATLRAAGVRQVHVRKVAAPPFEKAILSFCR